MGKKVMERFGERFPSSKYRNFGKEIEDMGLRFWKSDSDAFGIILAPADLADLRREWFGMPPALDVSHRFHGLHRFDTDGMPPAFVLSHEDTNS